MFEIFLTWTLDPYSDFPIMMKNYLISKPSLTNMLLNLIFFSSLGEFFLKYVFCKSPGIIITYVMIIIITHNGDDKMSRSKHLETN